MLRRAKLRISGEQVAAMLDLPPAPVVEVFAVESTIDPAGFIVHITGEAVPEAVPDFESPFAHSTITRTDDLVITEYHVEGHSLGTVTTPRVALSRPTIPLLDAGRAAALTSSILAPEDVALLSASRFAARDTFERIVEAHPPEWMRRANGQETARWATGSTLTIASTTEAWWRGKRFDALMLEAGELDLWFLDRIAPAFATSRRGA